MAKGICDLCSKPASSLILEGDLWICRYCGLPPADYEAPYFRENGGLKFNPKASKAHVRDVQDRRWHPQEKRMFYYSKEKPKTYFVPKG
jgi:hypothetical protein